MLNALFKFSSSDKKTMKNVLFIDDLRQPSDCMSVEDICNNLTICKNYKEGLKCITEKPFDIYYFDNDLGSIEPNETGYGLAKILLEKIKCDNFPEPEKIVVQSANVVDAKNIRELFKHYLTNTKVI